MAEHKFPSEVIDLPSEGKLYPKEHPCSNGKIEIKYMTAKEEDILTSQNLIKKGVSRVYFKNLESSSGWAHSKKNDDPERSKFDMLALNWPVRINPSFFLDNPIRPPKELLKLCLKSIKAATPLAPYLAKINLVFGSINESEFKIFS